MEIIELNNAIRETKNQVDELNSRVGMIEKTISEVEDRAIEFIFSEQQRENSQKKKKKEPQRPEGQ